ncbi:response regulator transcription factor [Salisediminibacterium beveridgei]|uniref:Two-component response regulator n=1 Tax=Salisediminibacterium beveridgei TaxID=632773 RepID=A0A1D7QSC0_9BACI|nr:LuxR C-terminal-related transcriptional regulator [Salisediminibacterium beveridgei]AOM81905.1 two-component response regulator [Salisediminibacterium beveridgei]
MKIERMPASREIVIDKELPYQLNEEDIVFLILGDYTIDTLDRTERMIEAIVKEDVPVLLLTVQEPKPSLFSYLHQGLSGIVSKNEFLDWHYLILNAIDQEGVYLDQALHGDMVEDIYRKKLRHKAIQRLVFRPDDVDVSLTKNEKQVLQLILDGHNNRRIAEIMFLAPSTVSTTISHLLKKIGANDRTDAMVKLIKNGWVDAVR